MLYKHWEHTIVERLGDIYYFRIESKVNTTILFYICLLPLAELPENCTITVYTRDLTQILRPNIKHARQICD